MGQTVRETFFSQSSASSGWTLRNGISSGTLAVVLESRRGVEAKGDRGRASRPLRSDYSRVDSLLSGRMPGF